MCNTESLRNIPLFHEFEIAAENISNFAASAATYAAYTSVQVLKGFANSVKHIDRITQNNDAYENFTRVVSNTFLTMNLLTNTANRYDSVLRSINQFQQTVSVGRIFGSVSYFVNGDFLEDLRPDNLHMLVSNIAFFIARVGTVMSWAVEHQIVEDLSVRLAPHFLENVVQNIKNFPVIDTAFTVALAGLAANRIESFIRGEGNMFYAADLASLTFDIALSVMPVFNVTNIYLTTAFALIAASTGVVSFLLNPEYA